MDMKKNCKIPDCGNLPDLKRFRLAVGAKQLKKAVSAAKTVNFGCSSRLFCLVILTFCRLTLTVLASNLDYSAA